MTDLQPKLSAPRVKLRTIKNLEEVTQLKNPSYRQVMDALLDHIKKNNLQDENYRIRIIIDSVISKIFGIEQETVSVNDLYIMVKGYVHRPNGLIF